MGETEVIKESQELTGMHGFVLGYLYNHQDEEVYQKDLEKRFEIRRSTATQILSLMEKNGLVLRQPVPRDARLKRLVLTEKAIEMHKEVVKEIEAIDSLLIAGVTEKELQTFFAVIDKVKANLTAKE
jgi:DNA-binding MarR family transcriptional regulator